MTQKAKPNECELNQIATKYATECMAVIGREMLKGTNGWIHGKDPQSFIREAIVWALIDAGAWKT